jgi:hypothetical protein
MTVTATVRASTSERPRSSRSARKASTTAPAITTPAGIENRPTRRRNDSCSSRASPGMSAKTKPGIPTVKTAARERCLGSSGNDAVTSPNVAITQAANTDFVTKSRATRCTLAMILRP